MRVPVASDSGSLLSPLWVWSKELCSQEGTDRTGFGAQASSGSLCPAKGKAPLQAKFATAGLGLGSLASFQDDILMCSDASNKRQ